MDDADAAGVDGGRPPNSVSSFSSASPVVPSSSLPSSFSSCSYGGSLPSALAGLPHKASAGAAHVSGDAGTEGGATGAALGAAGQSPPCGASFSVASEAGAAAADRFPASAAGATAATAENPFAFRARPRLLAPNTLLHPPGVFSSSAAAAGNGGGGESGSSRRRVSSFSSERQCGSSSSSKSSCPTFSGRETSGLLLLLPPAASAAAAGAATQNSSNVDSSSCTSTTTCSSSETESGSSNLGGSPALSFSMPATPRLRFHHSPGYAQKPAAYAACNVSPFATPAAAAGYPAAAGAAGVPAGTGAQTQLGLLAFSLPRAFLSESSAAARAWPAKRRRSIHVDGSSSSLLLPDQQMQVQQRQMQTRQQQQGVPGAVFAGGGRQQEDTGLAQQQSSSCSSGDARAGAGGRDRCSQKIGDCSSSTSGPGWVMGLQQQPVQHLECPSVAVVDGDAPGAPFSASSAGENVFRMAIQQPEEARREARGFEREEREREEMRKTSFLQAPGETLDAEKEDQELTDSARLAAGRLSSEDSSSGERCSSFSEFCCAGTSPSALHLSPALSSAAGAGASPSSAAAAEGSGVQRLEYLDSGCYSLCYHTAMAVVPYTALSTDSAAAQLLQQQQALLLDRDREARRRRKACLSVLRSVENALVASPRLDSQPSAAARRCASSAATRRSAAAAVPPSAPPNAAEIAAAGGLLLPPAESLFLTRGGDLNNSDDTAYSSPFGAAAASAGVKQQSENAAAGVGAGDAKAAPTHRGGEGAGGTAAAVADWAAAGPLHTFATPSSSPYFSFSAPPNCVPQERQIPTQQQLFPSSLCGSEAKQRWATATNFSGRSTAVSAGSTLATSEASKAFVASSRGFAAATAGESVGGGSNGALAASVEQQRSMEGTDLPAAACYSQQNLSSPTLPCPTEQLSEKQHEQQEEAATAGETLTASSGSSALLRLRPEWLSPYTLATLIGACVHCYDVLRAAYPPPEPPPRLCLVSLPALYTQLPPHLLAGAVLLDEAALSLGSPPQCLPLECSLISPPGVQQRSTAAGGRRGGSNSSSNSSNTSSSNSSDSSNSNGKESDTSTRTRDKCEEERGANTLPGNLLGQFDIIVCETRSVTLATIENIAACVKALSRRRRKRRHRAEKRATRLRVARGAGDLQYMGAPGGGGGRVVGGGYSGGEIKEEVYMQSSTSEEDEGEKDEGGGLEEEEDIDVAAAAFGSLSLFRPGEDSSGATPEKQLRQQLQHQLQQQETFQRLPSSVRVIMLSTCLLSAVVDDLLGLKQSRFQPYVPSSALSSLQLQCIYTNFDDYPRFQKHNDVDFTTRVRARRRTAHCMKGSRRARGFEDRESCRSSPKRSGVRSSSSSREAGTQGGGQHGGDVLLRDPLISRAMILQAEEEARAAVHTGEGAGEPALHSTTNDEFFSDESGAEEEPDDAAELMTGRHQQELQGPIRQPCQRIAEAALLNAFEALQLQSCTAPAAATVPPQQRLLQQQERKIEGSAASAMSSGFTCGHDSVNQTTGSDQLQRGTGPANTEKHQRLLLTGTTQTTEKRASSTSERVCNRQRSRAYRGITMRQGDVEDDGIDYDVECGSHFGMVPHEL